MTSSSAGLSHRVGTSCEVFMVNQFPGLLVKPHLQGKAFEVVAIHRNGMAELKLMPSAADGGAHVGDLNIPLSHYHVYLYVLTGVDHSDGIQAI